MPASGLDFGAIAAGGAGVTQAIEVANASEFPITVRVSGRGGSADVRPLKLALQIMTSNQYSSTSFSKCFTSFSHAFMPVLHTGTHDDSRAAHDTP